MHSGHVVSRQIREFISHFPHLRDVYIDIVDVVQHGAGLFTGPPGIPLFSRDEAFDDGPTYPSFTSLSLSGASLSRDISSTLKLEHIVALSLLDLVLRDDNHPTLMGLLTRMPLLSFLRIHMNWQYPSRQNDFWAPLPASILAPLIRNLRRISLVGYRIQIARLFNALGRLPTFALRKIALRLLCDRADTVPTFDEISAFNNELVHFADYVEVDSNSKMIKSKRVLPNGEEVSWEVTWQITNTTIGFWVRRSILLCALDQILIFPFSGGRMSASGIQGWRRWRIGLRRR